MDRMNREKALRLLVDWFAWNSMTSLLEGDYSPHAGVYSYYLLDQMEDDWVLQARCDWFPIFLDIVIHPPDLNTCTEWKFNNSTWDAEGEFFVSVRHFLGKWIKRWPDFCIQGMTPLLKNEIDVSANFLVSSSRELAFLLISSALDRVQPEMHDRLSEWIELIINDLLDDWNKSDESEKSIILVVLSAIGHRPTSKGYHLLERVKSRYPSETDHLDALLNPCKLQENKD